MKVLTLTQIKTHLRIELDAVYEDDYLVLLGTSAESFVSNYIGRSLPWVVNEIEVECPVPLVGAMLMIVADLYANREGDLERNPAVDRILDQYRIGFGV